MTEREILDIYWPVIEEARKVKQHYKTVICSDVVGELIKALNEAQSQVYIQRTDD